MTHAEATAQIRVTVCVAEHSLLEPVFAIVDVDEESGQGLRPMNDRYSEEFLGRGSRPDSCLVI